MAKNVAVQTRTNQPIIGIACDHDRNYQRYELPYGYVTAIVQAGGVPVLLPFHSAGELPAFIHGLLLTGGDDADPAAWGEARHPANHPIDPVREAYERRLLSAAERSKLPLLGVCFGMQLMNLARGGSLIQHLPDVPGRDDHARGEEGWGRRHDVSIVADSLLGTVCGGGGGGGSDRGEGLSINTSHHQAIARLGKGLVVTAKAGDGTIEAIEDPSQPFWLGVQWHPERMLEAARQMALFKALVDAAAKLA